MLEINSILLHLTAITSFPTFKDIAKISSLNQIRTFIKIVKFSLKKIFFFTFSSQEQNGLGSSSPKGQK